MPDFRCPVCKKPSRPSLPFFPFCSERCKLVDLGSWLDGRYRISRPLGERDLEEGAAENASPSPPSGEDPA